MPKMNETCTQTEDSEKRKQILAHRKAAKRHVLVIEAKLPHEEKVKLFALSERLRLAGNALTAQMQKRLDQLRRTKRWRGLTKAYAGSKDKAERKELAKELDAMRDQYGCTWEACREAMIPLGKKHEIPAVFALTMAEDVWAGAEKVLFRGARRLHFQKRGRAPVIRAKQPDRGIILGEKAGDLQVRMKEKGKVIAFMLKGRDRFECEELEAVREFRQNAEAVEEEAALEYARSGATANTGRPCYASVVLKRIRGRMRVYVHITMEGEARPKYRRDGRLRHTPGTGTVGCDIGTQTIAWAAEAEVGLANLGERGRCPADIEAAEKKLARKQRKLERSRRASNAENYNADGTVKRSRRKWRLSKDGKRLKKECAALSRRAAITRHLAAAEAANHMRELGDVLVTEPKNSARLMRRAKQTTLREDGRPNCKKRYGRSIKRRCPGLFQQKVQEKFERTGGRYIEVPAMYRASQYDHTSGQYEKKKLSCRMFTLADGTRVQRDCYSAFLLSCASDGAPPQIDEEACRRKFPAFSAKEKALIESIRAEGRIVKNSGISVKRAESSREGSAKEVRE